MYPLFILAAASPLFQPVLALEIYYAFAFVSYHHIRISCKYVSIWLEYSNIGTKCNSLTQQFIGTVIPRLTSDPANEFFG